VTDEGKKARRIELPEGKRHGAVGRRTKRTTGQANREKPPKAVQTPFVAVPISIAPTAIPTAASEPASSGTAEDWTTARMSRVLITNTAVPIALRCFSPLIRAKFISVIGYATI
jgi:hypothetical protein